MPTITIPLNITVSLDEPQSTREPPRPGVAATDTVATSVRDAAPTGPVAVGRVEVLDLLRRMKAAENEAAVAEGVAGEGEDAPVAELTRMMQRAADQLQQEGRHDGLLSAPDDRETALVQSMLAEYRAEQERTAGEEVPFDEHDLDGWFGFAFKWLKGRVNKRDFIPPTGNVASIPNNARIALLGDWGSGLYGAPRCSNTIQAAQPAYDVIIHLGDVYYAGTASEVRDRFLAFWPKVARARNYAINSNHEMYSGGEGYFDVTLKDRRFPQRSSCFAFRNDSFVVLGLDTAYDEHMLHGTQAEWVKDHVRDAGGRKVVLLSHHQPYSQFESGGEHLVEKLNDVLAGRKIFAWYWGHEHRCVVFERDARWNMFGRCVGHSGYPAFRDNFRSNEPREISNAGVTSWRRVARKGELPSALVLDGPNLYIPENKGGAYAPNGFMRLVLDGHSIHETVLSPVGATELERTIS